MICLFRKGNPECVKEECFAYIAPFIPPIKASDEPYNFPERKEGCKLVNKGEVGFLAGLIK